MSSLPEFPAADDAAAAEVGVAEDGPSSADGNRLLYAGLGLIVLSLLFSWWSVSKYRVYEERGVDLGSRDAREAITAKMSEDDKKDYQNRLDEYTREWKLNTTRFDDFYQSTFGKEFQVVISREEQYTRKTGTLSLRGWSTWTGLFGLIVVVAIVAVPLAPKWDPDWALFAWAYPLVQAALAGTFWLAAVAFYFTVPDANGAGYSQGVGLGNYLAILGASIALAVTVSVGVRSVAEHKAELAEMEEEEAEEAKPVAPKSPKKLPDPPKPEKNRLQDW